MNRFQGVWTLWSAGNGERAGEWVKCGEGGPEELADMLRCLFDWQRNGQRVRLEWSESSEPSSEPCTCRCREGRHCGGCGHAGCGYTPDQ